MKSPFHKGELTIQKELGTEKIAESVGRLILDKIQDRVIPFLKTQSSVFISSIDEHNQVWVSVLLGEKNMIEILDERKLSIHTKSTNKEDHDILFSNLISNKEVGLLFIDLATRVRYRINGVADPIKESIDISVEQAYPNCPKYIQRRRIPILDSRPFKKSRKEFGTTLNKKITDWILNADTFFVGSMNSNNRLDVSHRGGNPGFIEIIYGHTLKIPDYKGNNLFNTLGNFVENPATGLLFIDFNTGSILQLTGESKLLFDQNLPDDLIKTDKTGRYWTFEYHQWMITINDHPNEWEFIDNSPFNPTF